MKRKGVKSKILWGISMLVLFGVSYWICRYAFFQMHGMKQWPNLLAVFGITIVVVATLFGNRIIPVASFVGYLGGFILKESVLENRFVPPVVNDEEVDVSKIRLIQETVHEVLLDHRVQE